jgi:hypothetical protein
VVQAGSHHPGSRQQRNNTVTAHSIHRAFHLMHFATLAIQRRLKAGVCLLSAKTWKASGSPYRKFPIWPRASRERH